jgi:D-alanyl-lipoteichoic acid acyltransferase DltB (MBOAT superfamily)
MAFVPIYILILAFTIIIDYLAAIKIEKSVSKKGKKNYLIASIIANIGILIFFKYYNFINENISILLSWFKIKNEIPYLEILLPIGLSFHTFQAMSYTIEVYRGNQKAEKHFGIYSLYVLFYPQLVAGPIERPQNILHQFKEKKYLNYENLVLGLRFILFGLFKKVVIADRLAIIVNPIFEHPTSYNSLSLLIASIFFTYQIYCDFSGYSDIAIGTAKVMGFDLMKNFNYPYNSTSIKQFWSKWHISLSTWFKDYVYIPLGGNRVSLIRLCINTIIIFSLSGFWHGANWTFIVWGLLHAIIIIIETIFEKKIFISKIKYITLNKKSLKILFTFMIINFTWIFFRAKNLKTAQEFICRIFEKFPNLMYELYSKNIDIIEFKSDINSVFLSVILIIILELVNYISRHRNFDNLNAKVKHMCYIVATLSILLLGVFKENQFIYFQF